jgi:hypothetical protein
MTNLPKTPEEELISSLSDVFTGLWWPEFGRGWDMMVHRMAEEIRAVIQPGTKLVVHQMKEKFGGLRFYYSLEREVDPADDEELPDTEAYLVDQIVQKYEELSDTVCIICGMPGALRGKAWIEVLCDAHHKEITR